VEKEMNERIKELAKQNGFIHEWMPPGEQHDKLQSLEKFAELIVRECGEIAYKAYWYNPETVRGIHIKEKIKKHFGVGE
jgi:hypothetical protein